MQQDSKQRLGRTMTGFTLFEMVVVICSIVILYMVAEQRLNDLPAAAERANFQAVLEQIKTGVNFAMLNGLLEGDNQKIRAMEGTNPMDYLLDTPSNYLGEQDAVDDTLRRRNAWYFEAETGELVYLVGGASISDVWITIATIPVNLGQIRFRIENIYSGMNEVEVLDLLGEQPKTELVWEGIQLVPVHDFRWERRSESPVPLN